MIHRIIRLLLFRFRQWLTRHRPYDHDTEFTDTDFHP